MGSKGDEKISAQQRTCIQAQKTLTYLDQMFLKLSTKTSGVSRFTHVLLGLLFVLMVRHVPSTCTKQKKKCTSRLVAD